MLHPKLQPLFQLVEYSPTFTKAEVLDHSSFSFSWKKPWTDNDQHFGERLEFTCGIETWYTGPNKRETKEVLVYVMCVNTGDEEYVKGLQDFIHYINPISPWTKKNLKP